MYNYSYNIPNIKVYWLLQLNNSRIYNKLIKYKEGNNRPSSVNQISLVHNHDKAGNKCYSRQHEHSGKPKCENRCLGRVNLSCCGHAPVVESRV